MISFILISINLWSYRILSLNPLVLVLLTLVTWLLVMPMRRFRLILMLLLFSFLIYLQISTTNSISILTTTIEEQQIQRMRLNEYPPIERLPIAHWMEGRRESVMISKMQKNLFEAIDLNLYFFGNYPRPRSGVPEFEKLSYALLPIFLIGLLNFGSIINRRLIIILIGLSLLLISIIGHKNDLGPFILLPFIFSIIFQGFRVLNTTIQRYKYSKVIFALFFVALIISLVQQYAYSKY